MKTWEMIKELTENPGKKFVSDKGYGGSELTAYVEDGIIKFVYAGFGDQCPPKPSMGTISLSRSWEEVKEPVSFTEVLEAVKKKYDTEITFENNKHEISFERNSLEYILWILSDNWDSQEIADILLNSKFYISN
jgi:hypothetical protein